MLTGRVLELRAKLMKIAPTVDSVIPHPIARKPVHSFPIRNSTLTLSESLIYNRHTRYTTDVVSQIKWIETRPEDESHNGP